MNIGEKYQVMINVAEGLQFLHSMRFAHSDLKPENILLRDNGRAVIADLGSGFFLGVSKRAMGYIFSKYVCKPIILWVCRNPRSSGVNLRLELMLS